MTETWLITGSSRGFGWELARAALDHGDSVIATARLRSGKLGRGEPVRRLPGRRIAVLATAGPAEAW